MVVGCIATTELSSLMACQQQDDWETFQVCLLPPILILWIRAFCYPDLKAS